VGGRPEHGALLKRFLQRLPVGGRHGSRSVIRTERLDIARAPDHYVSLAGLDGGIVVERSEGEHATRRTVVEVSADAVVGWGVAAPEHPVHQCWYHVEMAGRIAEGRPRRR